MAQPIQRTIQRTVQKRRDRKSRGRLGATLQEYSTELKVGSAFALLAFFFSHGLPLWDDDYGVWLAQANGSFVDLLLRILSPFTSDPASWGYSDRPVQVLIYKVVSVAFGTWGTGYFLVKSLVFGALSGVLYHWMRKLDVGHRVACLSLAAFAVSANVVSALLWHSDFAFYTQLALALLFLSSLQAIERGPANYAAFRQALARGWDHLPAGFLRFCAIFFATVYFGSKIRGDLRIAPLVLLAWLAIYRRPKFKVWAVPFAVSFLATLPWSAALFKHLPPFVPGAAGWQGWTYTGFSISRALEFLALDMFSIRTAPLSVAGAMGVLFVLAGAVYAVFRAYRNRLTAPDATWGFFVLWFAIAVLGAGALAPQAHAFQLRYTAVLLVPAVLLLALGAQAAWEDLRQIRVFQYALPAVFGLQMLLSLFHAVEHRKDMGHTVVAIDKIFRAVEKDHPNGTFVLGPGFLPYAFRGTEARALVNRKQVSSLDEISRYPAGTVVASWSSFLDARYTVAQVATGCGASLFDLLSGCRPTDGGILMRYLGPVAEVEQSQQLDRQGNLQAAKQVIDAYLQKDPSNHGALFIAGLQSYRLGDFAKMEQAYERLEEFFPGHPSVVYNLGLAKQGLQKYAEAAQLLERAYAMVPKDYAIGFNLADTYYKQGKKSRALATLTELRKVYPDSKPIQDAFTKWNQ